MSGALAYHARKGGIHLRLVAYHPSLAPMPDDHLKVVVQVVDKGQPIAEDPIHTEVMTQLDLAQALHLSRNEGWELTPWEERHGN